MVFFSIAMMRSDVLKIVVVLAVFGVWGQGAPVRAQPDSVRAEILEQKGFSPTHSARGALWRAAAVPGWGQLYNRQYYKIPFVYAGLGVLGYTIHQADAQYRLFRRAALFKNETVSRPEFESEYLQAVQEVTGCSTRQECETTPLSGRILRQQRDKLRRRRNLAIIGTGLFYAITILDAYVSAHLLTFDVDDNLSLRVEPTGSPGGERTARHNSPALSPRPGVFTDGMGLRLKLAF